MPAWSLSTSAGSSGMKAQPLFYTCQFLEMFVQGCFHFSREKCCPSNTGWLPTIRIEFHFCLLFGQYSTLHSIPPPCAWCTRIPRFSGFFPAIIRWLGSDGDLALWNKRVSLMSKLNCRFSSVLCIVSSWLKPHLLSRLNGSAFLQYSLSQAIVTSAIPAFVLPNFYCILSYTVVICPILFVFLDLIAIVFFKLIFHVRYFWSLGRARNRCMFALRLLDL